MNWREEDARARKVRRIFDAIMEVRATCKPVPTMEDTFRTVLGWQDADWARAAAYAGQKIPSAESRHLVLVEIDLRLPAARKPAGRRPDGRDDNDARHDAALEES